MLFLVPLPHNRPIGYWVEQLQEFKHRLLSFILELSSDLLHPPKTYNDAENNWCLDVNLYTELRTATGQMV